MPSVPDPMKSLGFTEQFLASRRAQYIEEDKHFVIEQCSVRHPVFHGFLERDGAAGIHRNEARLGGD
jgi:hypothetical protein